MSPEKIKPFDSSPAPIMSNLGNGRMIFKFNNAVLVQKSKFIFNLYIHSFWVK